MSEEVNSLPVNVAPPPNAESETVSESNADNQILEEPADSKTSSVEDNKSCSDVNPTSNNTKKPRPLTELKKAHSSSSPKTSPAFSPVAARPNSLPVSPMNVDSSSINKGTNVASTATSNKWSSSSIITRTGSQSNAIPLESAFLFQSSTSTYLEDSQNTASTATEDGNSGDTPSNTSLYDDSNEVTPGLPCKSLLSDSQANQELSGNQAAATDSSFSGSSNNAVGSAGIGSGLGGSSTSSGEHYVMVHINAGETFSVRVGDQIQHIPGPATVRMVSNNGPPLPMPMQVPPGHLVQQIVDEKGILTHVILSPYPGPAHLAGGQGPPPGAAPHHLMAPPPPSSGAGSILVSSSSTNAPGSYSSGSNAKMSYPYSGNYMQQSPNYGHHGFGGYSIHHHPNIDDHRPPKSRGRGVKRYHHGNQKDVGQMGNYYHHSHHHGYQHHYNNQGGGNNRRRKNRMNGSNYRRDMYSASSSSEENTYEDEECRAIKKVLSTMLPVHVLEVESRTALIQIFLPETPPSNSPLAHIDPSELTFELLLSENGPDGRYNCVFSSFSCPEPLVFDGSATKICLQDLKPAFEYHVKACSVYDRIRGNLTDPVSFFTQPCEPAPPKPPQLTNRNRFSLSIRWTSPPDHGSKVTSFVLEWSSVDAGPREFTELYSGNQRHYKVMKLQPSTEYCFRLAAVNAYGQSDWSDTVSFCTTGTAPNQPDAPQLKLRQSRSLTLYWSRIVGADCYTLQMEDSAVTSSSSSGGFVPVYKGKETYHVLENLRRASAYKFKLAAGNEEGTSKWSEIVTFTTLPDPVSEPVNVKIIGAVKPSEFTVTWGVPQDNGGSTILQYRVDITEPLPNNDSATTTEEYKWKTVYEGKERRFKCTSGFQSGSSFMLRVQAQNAIGSWGKSSGPIKIEMPALPPGKCDPPRLANAAALSDNKAKSNTIKLTWDKSPHDCAAYVAEYEVSQCLVTSNERNDDDIGGSRVASSSDTSILIKDYSSPNSWCEEDDDDVDNAGPIEGDIIYRGALTECTTEALLPHCPYTFRVRAINSAGRSAWSEPITIESGATPPPKPDPPAAVCKSAHTVLISWWDYQQLSIENKDKKKHHHQQQQQQQQQQQHKTNNSSAPGGPSSSVGEEEVVSRSDISAADDKVEYRLEQRMSTQSDFIQVYQGDSLEAEVSNLQPDTGYSYRLFVINIAGESAPSELVNLQTPASSPSQVTTVRINDVTANSAKITWKAPCSNGSPITGYVIDLGSGIIVNVNDTIEEYKIEGLMPETIYKARVQAVNSVGSGPVSPSVKFCTCALPPLAPVLECVGTQASSLKLRWSDCKVNDNGHYTLEMAKQLDNPSWQVIYNGPGHTFKVTRLSEMSEYFFRIVACNEAGNGEYSEVIALTTSKAAPPSVRPPKICELSTTSCRIEWPAIRPMNQDEIRYSLQLLSHTHRRGGCNEFKEIYRGSETSLPLTNLSPATEYHVRVCAIRLSSSCADLIGPFSQTLSFTTRGGSNQAHLPAIHSGDGSGRSEQDSDHRKNWFMSVWAAGRDYLAEIPADRMVAIAIFIIFIFLAIGLTYLAQNVFWNISG